MEKSTTFSFPRSGCTEFSKSLLLNHFPFAFLFNKEKSKAPNVLSKEGGRKKIENEVRPITKGEKKKKKDLPLHRQ